MPPTRVLAVDDDEDVGALLALWLTHTGYDVRVVTSGAEALVCAATFDPDVVLLDLGLPHMDGYEVAARLRRALPLRTPRIVALTGSGAPSDRQRTRDAGFDDHQPKPFAFESLRASIDIGRARPAAALIPCSSSGVLAAVLRDPRAGSRLLHAQ